MTTYVRDIGFEIQTSNVKDAGTDSRVSVTILRDDDEIVTWVIEPGNTPRLNRGEYELYSYTITGNHSDTSIGVEPASPLSGEVEPPQNYLAFRAGVKGRLRCRLRIYGTDLWKVESIQVSVRYLHTAHVPGTFDTFAWVPDSDWHVVGQFKNLKMSSDSSEGYRSITLKC